MHNERTANEALADYNAREWEQRHGYFSDSYFSGILVRYASDNESVIVGRYYS